MIQYAQWVISLAKQLNELYNFLFKLTIVEVTDNDDRNVRAILKWLKAFECLILHPHLPQSDTIKEYQTNLISHNIVIDRLRQARLLVTRNNRLSKFTGIQLQMFSNLSANIRYHTMTLLDYVVHNCHTFSSQMTMTHGLHLLISLTSALCPILHFEYFRPSEKTIAQRQSAILYYRIVQIMNIKFPNFTANIQPPYITYPTQTYFYQHQYTQQ